MIDPIRASKSFGNATPSVTRNLIFDSVSTKGGGAEGGEYDEKSNWLSRKRSTEEDM